MNESGTQIQDTYKRISDSEAKILYCEKKRGLDITLVGQEAKIHWNGPPVHHFQTLGETTLDRHFGGRRKWHLVTRQNKKDSTVTSHLKMEEPKLPFYQ